MNEISIKKNETEYKINESTSITKSNNVESNNSKFNNDNNKSSNLIINENIENEDNIKIFSKINEDKNISNEINKEQRYFIEFINSKEVDKEKNNSKGILLNS